MTDPNKPSRGMYAAKRMKFTKPSLDQLLRTRPHRQHLIWDDHKDGKGLCVLVSRGPKHARRATVTFRTVYYLPNRPGKPRYKRIGGYPDTTIDDARKKARRIRADAEEGIDPKRPPATGDFVKIIDEFLVSHAKRRSFRETSRILNTYVRDEWADKKITDIKRLDVAMLLDKIKAGKIRHKETGAKIGTPTVANATLAQLSSLFNWHAKRSNEFRSPIVKGMLDKEDKPKVRDRVLNDAELRTLWPLLDGPYGAVIKSALLTGQRFHKVSSMRRSDLKDQMTIPSHRDKTTGEWVEEMQIDNVWDASTADDPDNKLVSAVPLSQMARDVIASVPVIVGDGDYVFSLNGNKPINGWSKFNKRLDVAFRAALQKQDIEFRPWQHRDLRRTARTLMSRAGISTEIAEHCLGHKRPRIERTYNRHAYLHEKQDAFAQLADAVQRIVNQAPANVVPMKRKRR